MSKGTLLIKAEMGMAGDMFCAALIKLGAPEKLVTGAMRTAADLLGGASIVFVNRPLLDGTSAGRITVKETQEEPLAIAETPSLLERALLISGIRGGYAGFAHRALAILCQAEGAVHASCFPSSFAEPSAALTFIGRAHTPYQSEAPFQPRKEAENHFSETGFYIDLEPGLAPGLRGLDSFSHLFILSYLERSSGYTLLVRPPWKDNLAEFGVFATRSPNRPNPIGLTRARIRSVEGSRIYTSPLDLFDGTPVLDIKPFIQSIDGPEPGCLEGEEESGNDGWLAGSGHLELHRLGIPHRHPGGGQLHEARDILVDLVGAASALQFLGLDLDRVRCVGPVRVGAGSVDSGSHGRLPVPAPATDAILQTYRIPWEPGPVRSELLTPTGAAILAALSPSFQSGQGTLPRNAKMGVGMGTRVFQPPHENVLRLFSLRDFGEE